MRTKTVESYGRPIWLEALTNAIALRPNNNRSKTLYGYEYDDKVCSHDYIKGVVSFLGTIILS